MSSLTYLACDQPFCDIGRQPEDFQVFPLEKTEDIFTKKTYCARFEWGWTLCNYPKKQAAYIVAYVKNQLNYADEVEIWHIWAGASYPPPRIKNKSICIQDLTPGQILALNAAPAWETVPLASHIAIPAEWGIEPEDLEVCTHYCCHITKHP